MLNHDQLRKLVLLRSRGKHMLAECAAMIREYRILRDEIEANPPEESGYRPDPPVQIQIKHVAEAVAVSPAPTPEKPRKLYPTGWSPEHEYENI